MSFIVIYFKTCIVPAWEGAYRSEFELPELPVGVTYLMLFGVCLGVFIKSVPAISVVFCLNVQLMPCTQTISNT